MNHSILPLLIENHAHRFSCYNGWKISPESLEDFVGIRNIISFQHEDYSETIKSISKNNFIIDYLSLSKSLKEQQEKDELIELKKKLINLWLPLAIDIQGISEVREREKQVKYFKEMKEELLSEGYLDKQKKDWGDLKDFLKNDCDVDMPITLIDFIGKLEPIDAFVTNDVKDKDKEIESEFHKTYLTKTKENPNYFPNWLQKVVEILDERISPKNPTENKQ